MGRPKSTERPEWADRVLAWLHTGRSLLKFCEQPGSPSRRAIYDWTDRDAEFGAQFARARAASADVLVDLAQDVADDGRNDTQVDEKGNVRIDYDVVARSKLRVDVLLKRAACFDPRRYGTKVAVGGDPDSPPIRVLSNAERVHRVQALLSQVVVEPLALTNTDEVKELLG